MKTEALQKLLDGCTAKGELWVVRKIGERVYVESDAADNNPYPFICDMQAEEAMGWENSQMIENDAKLLALAPALAREVIKLRRDLASVGQFCNIAVNLSMAEGGAK